MKIYLFCDAGMSTSLMVKKMQDVAKEESIDCEIAAYSLSKIDDFAEEADVLLLGPQVKYKLNKVKEEYSHKPVECIEMVDYGMLNGKKVLEKALSLINEK